MTLRFPVLLVTAALLAACAGAAPRADGEGATFIVVRHAEKAGDGAPDPDLSAAGLARARALAHRLADARVGAVYSTDFRRTRQTALPTAREFGLATVAYDAQGPADAFASRLKAAHPAGTVLVVGHSNTVPDIVAALCGCAVDPMPETEYDRWSEVRVAADGRARLQVGRYGAPATAP